MHTGEPVLTTVEQPGTPVPTPVEQTDGAALTSVVQPSPLAVLRAGGRRRTLLRLLGPAFVAAVAYTDPGIFATNCTAGARYGHLLVWVIIAANLVVMLVQYPSAKIGIVTGKDLPELCREHFRRPVTIGLWFRAELVAMATDLAQFVGLQSVSTCCAVSHCFPPA